MKMSSIVIFLALSLLAAVVGVGVLYPGVGGDFIFDDSPNIVKNYSLHVTSLGLDELLFAAYSFQPGGGTRFLPMLSFALDYWRGGLDPAVFHVTNLLIHAATTVSLAYFLRALLLAAGVAPARAARVALVVGLLWAIHPLQVSSALYAVQRMQTLTTLFIVLALLTYIQARVAQIEARPSRPAWLMTMLWWLLAVASKEDSVLLPAYALLIELTVLRFRTASAAHARYLRGAYALFVLGGLMVYIFAIVPSYWRWEAYGGRDFSSYERLLTQGRVLVMYLGQILLPLPERLPFYYDHIVVSRSLFAPATTLLALILIAALIVGAWFLRLRRPLFAFGVLFFFAGHFVTSNVIGLELAFEHRNHLPLIGALLALVDVVLLIVDRMRLRVGVVALFVAAVAIAAGSLTVTRATIWGDSLVMAEKSVEFAPGSVRARLLHCSRQYRLSGGDVQHPAFERAIVSCEAGADLPGSAALVSNVVTFRSLNGTVTDEDWTRYYERLRTVALSPENRNTVWAMTSNVRRGLPLDADRVHTAVDILVSRRRLSVPQYIHAGFFVLEHSSRPSSALAFFEQAVLAARAEDTYIPVMLADLTRAGRDDWVEQLAAMWREKLSRRE